MKSNENKEKRNRIFSIPTIITVAALIIIVFVQDNNYLRNHENQKKIAALLEEIKLNEDSAQYYRDKSAQFTSNRELVEKVAREQYHMKRQSEDVYITSIK